MKSHTRFLTGKVLLLAIGLLFASLTSAQQKINSKSTILNGLRKVEFQMPNGKITVNLPSTIVAGDVISGRVVVEPAGTTESKLRKNRGKLNSYAVVISGVESAVGQPLQFPTSITKPGKGIDLILKNEDGKEVSRMKVPVVPEIAPVINPDKKGLSNYKLPKIGQIGKPIQVLGRFDGSFSTSQAKMGGKPAALLAESPRSLFVENPGNVIGLTDLEISEEEDVVGTKFRNIDVQMSAEKLNMPKGKQTTLTITVWGLDSLEEDIPLQLVNNSPGVVRIEGGNEQLIIISPGEVRENSYHWTGSLTGIKSGSFEIAASVEACSEALLRVDKSKQAFLSKLDTPLASLQTALDAAEQLSIDQTTASVAYAMLKAEQTRFHSLKQYLDIWDNWFEEKLEKQATWRETNYGSRTPSWAHGSEMRARRRHNEKTENLRQQMAQQQQKVNLAQQVANAGGLSLAAAHARFAEALDAFKNDLANLKNAKDLFAGLVEIHWRCSPCKIIASHWASTARLNELLDQLLALLDQSMSNTATQLKQAQQQAASAQETANTAMDKFKKLENRRSEIEQAMRDAVKTDDNCISLKPVKGWGWSNLASMDRVRRAVIPKGAAMGWRSNFKGSEVRVYVQAGCLSLLINNVKWGQINKLNEALQSLQTELAEAGHETADAQLAADIDQAAANGLQSEMDALNQLVQTLNGSGLKANTAKVLKRLDELSSGCNQAIKEAVGETAAYRKTQRAAERKAVAAEGERAALRRRAERARNKLKRINAEDGDESDHNKYRELLKKAGELADDSEDIEKGGPSRGTSPAPATPEEAELQNRAAKHAAEAAENRANALKDDNKALDNAVKDIENRVEALRKRVQAWRKYRDGLKAYRNCLKAKQTALSELAEMDKTNASTLQELAKKLGEAADKLEETASLRNGFDVASPELKGFNKALGELTGKLQRLGNAMEMIDAVMRADDINPSEKLAAMSKSLEELRNWLPEIPGVSEMLAFYNEAMTAIAGALKKIEARMSKKWADAVFAGAADVKMVPVGIRKEVKRLVKIRRLMKIVSRSCGKLPVPPGE